MQLYRFFLLSQAAPHLTMYPVPTLCGRKSYATIKAIIVYMQLYTNATIYIYTYTQPFVEPILSFMENAIRIFTQATMFVRSYKT